MKACACGAPTRAEGALLTPTSDFVDARYLHDGRGFRGVFSRWRAVLQIIDPDQCGGIPRSSTLCALISMIHLWSQATDAASVTVRVVLFDPR